MRWDCPESSVEGLGRVHTHFVGTYALNSPSSWGSRYLPADFLPTPILLLLLFSYWSCLTLCDPMGCSPPSFSVHEISQARILEWVAVPSSRESSRPRDRTHFLHWQVDSLPQSHREKPIIISNETLLPMVHNWWFNNAILAPVLPQNTVWQWVPEVKGPQASYAVGPWLPVLFLFLCLWPAADLVNIWDPQLPSSSVGLWPWTHEL